MKELGNSESAKEIAKLKKRNLLKSPVRTKVLKFEGKTKDDLKSPVKRYQSPSPTRTKSPAINKERPNHFLSPTRSQSPGTSSYRSNQVFSPSRSKSPSINIERPNKLFSPTRSKSPSVNSGTSSPSRSKSPGIKRERLSQSFGSPSSPDGNWTLSSNSWQNDGPDVTGTNPRENTPTRSSPKVGDTVDVSWYLDNLDFVTSPDAEGASQNEPGPSPKVERKEKSDKRMLVDGEEKMKGERFRNVLNYDMAAWEEVTSGEPKKADEFIQRLCEQVRDQVEYMCGMNFVSYQAISYKIKIAGAEGILYYVKVNVWTNYCIHLRIFSQKNEFKATPKLQAILERAEPDRGNIEFF